MAETQRHPDRVSRGKLNCDRGQTPGQHLVCIWIERNKAFVAMRLIEAWNLCSGFSAWCRYKRYPHLKKPHAHTARFSQFSLHTLDARHRPQRAAGKAHSARSRRSAAGTGASQQQKCFLAQGAITHLAAARLLGWARPRSRRAGLTARETKKPTVAKLWVFVYGGDRWI